MKNKLLIVSFLICSSFFGLSSRIGAQEGAVRFNKKGFTVAIKTEAVPAELSNRTLGNISNSYTSASSENTMHRLITDRKNGLYFGYDVVVSPQAEAGKFRVSIKPLSINPNRLINVGNLAPQNLTTYPDEILVSDGDIITLEILEDPQTKVKIIDLIKVTTENRRVGDYFLDRKPARDFTIDDVELELTDMEIFINDKRIGKGGGMSGGNIYFHFQEYGFIVMSPFPRPGINLQKIGVVENNVIKFTSNGNNFKFVSTAPILGNGGKWNLWVWHDPENKLTSKGSEQVSPYNYGAADRIESIIKKK